MKILLINPPLFERKLRWDQGSTYPPLGLAYIAAILEKEGYYVKIIDCQASNMNEERIINIIKKENPDVIGITSITTQHKQVLKTVDIAKKASKKSVKIIVGGPHSSLMKDKLMKLNKNIDFIIKHEGEITILRLMEAIQTGKGYEKVEGILFKKGDNVIETKDRDFIKNLDQLPLPARHMLDLKNKKYCGVFRYKRTPMTSVITSRGCPYNCIFCDHVFGRAYRMRTAENVIKEIESLQKKYGIREVHFVDDTFLLDPERTKNICNTIIKNKIDITWSCNGRIDIIDKNMNLVPLLKKAGCWYISFGIESGNRDVLNFLRKGIKFEEVRRVIKWVHKNGIFTKGYFMIGNPTETKKTIRESINFAKSLDLDGVQFSFVIPYPYSEFHELSLKYGHFDAEDYDKMSSHSEEPVYVPYGMTKKYLKNIQKKAYREFYGRPLYIWGQFIRIRDWQTLKKYIKRGIVFLFKG